MSTDTMSDLCVKTIVDRGSRFDQLVYGLGAVVHNAVCFEQKQGTFDQRHTLGRLSRNFVDRLLCHRLRPVLTLPFPHLWQKLVYQSVQHHTGLTHARVPECQKINNGGLDQYGSEHSEV